MFNNRLSIREHRSIGRWRTDVPFKASKSWAFWALRWSPSLIIYVRGVYLVKSRADTIWRASLVCPPKSGSDSRLWPSTKGNLPEPKNTASLHWVRLLRGEGYRSATVNLAVNSKTRNATKVQREDMDVTSKEETVTHISNLIHKVAPRFRSVLQEKVHTIQIYLSKRHLDSNSIVQQVWYLVIKFRTG